MDRCPEFYHVILKLSINSNFIIEVWDNIRCNKLLVLQLQWGVYLLKIDLIWKEVNSSAINFYN